MVTGSDVPGRKVIQALLTGQGRMFPRSWILSMENLERSNFHGKFLPNRAK
jgi:hypothetical protein